MSLTRRHAALGLALALTVTGGLVAATSGLARTHQTTVVKSAHNSHQNKQIVVNASGVTLYLLTGDTPRHLKCTHKLVGGLDCLSIWKPLTVRSSSTSAIKAGSGVSGKLGLFRRAKNSYQVTLRGIPLYTFVPDNGQKGAVGGEGIHSFHGVWHTLPASTRAANPTPTPTPAPMPTPGYP
jgi:predicted lipoprotein with Yx(FWY)xxD motif